jgi:hypothetical protein
MRKLPWFAALALLAAPLAACSGHPAQTLHGVEWAKVDTATTSVVQGDDGDLRDHTTQGAVLDGPHYTLALSDVAVGTTLGSSVAQGWGIAPVRAPEGQQLVVAMVDTQHTYAPFGKAAVDVSVVIGGHATTIPGLPFRDTGTYRSSTVAILATAPRHTPIRLRATDTGRAESLDLRTGRVVTDTFHLRQSKEVRWSGSTAVEYEEYTLGYGVPNPGKLSAGTATITGGSQVASLTSYAPSIGWAPKGSAILLVPSAGLSVASNAELGFAYMSLHEKFSDRSVYSVRTNDGTTVHAQPYRRDERLWDSAVYGDDAAVVFVVPADTLAGTVTMNLAKAQLVEYSGKSARNISWTDAPAPFSVKLTLASS